MKNFVLGTSIGIVVAYLVFHKPQKSLENPVIETAPPSVAAATASAPVVKNQPKEKANERTPQPVATATAESRYFTFKLDLEHLIQIENAGDRILDYAYTQKESDGHRFHLLDGDQVFASLGIRDGDLFTYENLNRQLANTEQSPLVVRFQTILVKLER